jgi:hypothetical protein
MYLFTKPFYLKILSCEKLRLYIRHVHKMFTIANKMSFTLKNESWQFFSMLLFLHKGIVEILSDNANVPFACSHSVQIIYARLDNSIPLRQGLTE